MDINAPGEISLFTVNIGMSDLMPSIDRNAVLIGYNEPISSAVTALMQLCRADLIGTWRAKG
jgi:hypothetical protein